MRSSPDDVRLLSAAIALLCSAFERDGEAITSVRLADGTATTRPEVIRRLGETSGTRSIRAEFVDHALSLKVSASKVSLADDMEGFEETLVGDVTKLASWTRSSRFLISSRSENYEMQHGEFTEFAKRVDFPDLVVGVREDPDAADGEWRYLVVATRHPAVVYQTFEVELSP